MNYRGIYTFKNILFTLNKHRYFVFIVFFAFVFGFAMGKNSVSDINKVDNLSLSQSQTPSNEIVTEITSSGNIKMLETINKNISQTKINGNQLNSCIQNNINSCIFSNALDEGKRNNDTSFCNVILDPNQKIACSDEILINKVTKMEDCESISINRKAECAFNSGLKNAKKENNKDYCNKIDSFLQKSSSGLPIAEMWSSKKCLSDFNSDKK